MSVFLSLCFFFLFSIPRLLERLAPERVRTLINCGFPLPCLGNSEPCGTSENPQETFGLRKEPVESPDLFERDGMSGTKCGPQCLSKHLLMKQS